MALVDTFSSLRTEIAGLSVVQLAEQFGTPTYVYDLATIEAKVRELSQFDVVRFAQKSCNNIAILDRLRRLGVVVDAVTAGEVGRAMAAGYQAGGHEIVYTADIIDRVGLECVKQYGLPVNCGSPEMITQVGEICPGANVTLRINPGFGHGHSQKTNTGGPQSKHGIWHEQIDMCLRLADQAGVTVTGLHMHIGSGTDFEHLAQVCDAMESAALQVGRTVQMISAGGGMPVPYQPDDSRIDVNAYFELWDATRNRLSEKFGHRLSLEIEPGRYLVAESGFLLTELRAIKEMGSNRFYLVDAGFNDLARPILYGAYHPISVSRRNQSASDIEVDAIVGGPLCESGDIFTQDEGGFVTSRRLPAAVVGDFLVIEVAGAYGSVMSSNYNGRFRSAEVLIEHGQAKLVRKRETLDDLIRNESIPPVE